MPANARWSSTGWGRTPMSQRRQVSPSFTSRAEAQRDTDGGTQGVRFVSGAMDSISREMNDDHFEGSFVRMRAGEE